MLEGHKLCQCNACHRRTSVKAGTNFHKTYLLLTKWFLAMHLLTQGKHSFSALELKRLIGVSCETAWKVRHKPWQVTLERERGRALSERIEADDARRGGERYGGKRGRGSAGKSPMLAAVQTSPDENPSERKAVYLKVQAVPNLKAGRSSGEPNEVWSGLRRF